MRNDISIYAGSINLEAAIAKLGAIDELPFGRLQRNIGVDGKGLRPGRFLFDKESTHKERAEEEPLHCSGSVCAKT